MIRKLTILLFLTLVVQAGKANAQNGFDLVYDFCTDTTVSSAIHSCYADTNRFFVFGGTNTAGVSPQHGFLAGFDYNKQLLWSKKMLFPGWRNSSTTNNGIIKLGTNKYLALGMTLDYNMRPEVVVMQPYLYTFEENGDSIMFRQYIDTFKLRYYETALFHNNSIVTAGCITSKGIHKVGSGYDYDSEGVWICKYDTLGTVIWEKEYMHGPVKYPNIGNIVLSADGLHYVIAGDMRDTITKTTGSRIIKIDTAGNIKWIKPLLKQYTSWGYMTIVTNPSGGYYFVSSSSKIADIQGIPQFSALYYGKLNEDGDTLWTNTFIDTLNYNEGYQIRLTNDKRHLVMIGSAMGKHAGMLKTDTSGNVVFWRVLQHSYNFADPNADPYHELESLCMTPDGRYLAAGQVEGTAVGGNISWMILTDSNGCRYPNDPACWPVSVSNVPNTGSEVRIYPNPVTDMLYAELPDGIKEAMVSVTDIRGKVMLHQPLRPGRNAIDISGYAPGMYFVKLTGVTGIIKTEKIVKR